MTENLVAIVIINYNSSKYTIECLKSIKDVVDPNFNYSIIIIDNNSKTDDYKELKTFVKAQQDIKLVRSKVNLGFSGANMLAAQYIKSEYIFFLNNDTVLINDCVSILYNYMKSNKNSGICTGQMFNTDLSFHHSFNYFPTLATRLFGTGLMRLIKPENYPKKQIEYNNPLKVNYVTGAAMFIDYAKIAEIGGFDTNYFLYCEEEDIAMLMKQNNYDIYLVPEAKFVHHMGKSTIRNFNIEKENYISRLYFHKKHSNTLAYSLHKFLYFLKNIKKFYKDINFIKLSFFIIFGAKMKYSMKHKQKLSID